MRKKEGYFYSRFEFSEVDYLVNCLELVVGI